MFTDGCIPRATLAQPLTRHEPEHFPQFVGNYSRASTPSFRRRLHLLTDRRGPSSRCCRWSCYSWPSRPSTTQLLARGVRGQRRAQTEIPMFTDVVVKPRAARLRTRLHGLAKGSCHHHIATLDPKQPRQACTGGRITHPAFGVRGNRPNLKRTSRKSAQQEQLLLARGQKFH
jgi:hypothetical protein